MPKLSSPSNSAASSPEGVSLMVSDWWKARNDYVTACEEVSKAKVSLTNDRPQPPAVLSAPLVIWQKKTHAERPTFGVWTRQELQRFIDGKVKVEAWIAGEGQGTELIEVPESGRQAAQAVLNVLIDYENGFSAATTNLENAEANCQNCQDALVDRTINIGDVHYGEDATVTVKTDVLASIVKEFAVSLLCAA